MMKLVYILLVVALLHVTLAERRPIRFGQMAASHLNRRAERAERAENSESSVSESLEDGGDTVPAPHGFALSNDNASYTHWSLKFTVPPLPTNEGDQYLEITCVAQTAVLPRIHEPFNNLGIVLSYESTWAIYSCVCAAMLAECNCTDYVDVSPGDELSVTLALQDGRWIATAANSEGIFVVERSVEATAFGGGPIGLLGVHYMTLDVDNCNNHPPSNKLDFTDMLIEDNGNQVTNPKYMIAHVFSPCSFQVNTNEVVARITWNSNDWTGSETAECQLQYWMEEMASWIENGETYRQYGATILNWAATGELTNLTFSLEPAPSSVWQLNENSDGSFSLPDYGFPLTADNYEGFHFGFISTQRPLFENVKCVGGEPVRIGDEPGKPKTGSAADLSDLGDNDCSVEFTQTVQNTWTDDNAYVEVNVVLRNSGARTVNTLEFAPASEINAWIVNQLENNNYALPLYHPTLPSGTTFSFGYIAQAGEAVEFEVKQISCN